MKLGFRYKKAEDGELDVAVFDVETGRVVEMVQSVSIVMRAGDQYPMITLTCIGALVDIDSAEVENPDQLPATFPVRERSIDLDRR